MPGHKVKCFIDMIPCDTKNNAMRWILWFHFTDEELKSVNVLSKVVSNKTYLSICI